MTLRHASVIGAGVLLGVWLIVGLDEPEEPTTPPVAEPQQAEPQMPAVAPPAAPQTPEWLNRCDANNNGRVTCAEARSAACGAPIPVTSDHPLYQFMQDGDGDGQVCE